MGKRGKSASKSARKADNAPAPLQCGPIILPDGCHEALHDRELQAKILKVYDKHNATKYRQEQRKRARQAA